MQVQSSCRERAEVLSRCCGSAEVIVQVQRWLRRGGAEVVQRWCRAGAGAKVQVQVQVQCEEQFAEVVQSSLQRWCRDAGAEQLQREGQMC